MPLLALTNAKIFDGITDELESDTVIIEGSTIRELRRGSGAGNYDVVDCEGRRLMPGLIDAHVHVYAHDVNLIQNDRRPMTLLAHRASAMLGRSLKRGFTTVRDCGGADYGLWLAIQNGWFPAPRLYYCGRMLSQTGGHGDFRHPHEHSADFCWSCGPTGGHIAIAVDGEQEVRRAVRDTLRRGASFIKFAASGGVTSIAGSVKALQFSDAEVAVIVEETSRAGAYCTAHIHPDEGIQRAIRLGVPCVEHASMITPETARLATSRGTFIVPTMAVARAISEHGEALGYPPESLIKMKPVQAAMKEGLQALRDAETVVGFGSDLLGPLEAEQCTEFEERQEVFSRLEILQQATSTNAKILGQEGLLGRVAPGALADILVMERDPVDDLASFDADGSAIKLLMKGGSILRQ